MKDELLLTNGYYFKRKEKLKYKKEENMNSK